MRIPSINLEWAAAVYLACMILALLIGRVARIVAIEFVGGLMLIPVIALAVYAICHLLFLGKKRRKDK